ncbi:hypothetical protein IF1G_04149 [Cordyceps javanica]|uniref:Uncharacterized protein n=1 Tax=Cordyceps javanica TaxID=43265 RepID=A0A545V5B4_9HYPO|nr:hypothetical protein IF1G_04149 [Cordyceps javanica]
MHPLDLIQPSSSHNQPNFCNSPTKTFLPIEGAPPRFRSLLFLLFNLHHFAETSV